MRHPARGRRSSRRGQERLRLSGSPGFAIALLAGTDGVPWPFPRPMAAQSTSEGGTMRRFSAALGLVALLTGSSAPVAHSYVGGPVRNVTDLAPTCAGCHSSFNREQ